MNAFPLLSALIFLPLAGSVAAVLLAKKPELSRAAALGTALAELVLAACALPLAADPAVAMVEDFAWIPRFGIRYSLSMDGLSGLLVLMTAFLGVLAVLVSWKEIEERAGAYYAFLLAVETSACGVFLAQDLFLFYLFWEVQLVPMFFIIGTWGHEDRRKAALKFFLFSIAGGMLMLLAVIGAWLVQPEGARTFSLAAIMAAPAAPHVQNWLYAAFLLAFAVKMPIVPVHTWLPDAHTQAPTAGSLILAGVLLKTGAYGLIRLAFPLFPDAAAASVPILFGLGLAGLYHASFAAMAQTDAKRLVAYSSVAHMALIVIGVAAWNETALSGAMLQMLNHALTTGGLFIMIGMLSHRTGSRELSSFGGVWKRSPVLGAFFLFFCMASAGLPGLNNFVSELLTLAGTWKGYPGVAAAAFCGVILTLVYVLKLAQGVLFGQPAASQPQTWHDASPLELCALAPLALAVLYLGFAPQAAIDLLSGPAKDLLPRIPQLFQ